MAARSIFEYLNLLRFHSLLDLDFLVTIRTIPGHSLYLTNQIITQRNVRIFANCGTHIKDDKKQYEQNYDRLPLQSLKSEHLDMLNYQFVCHRCENMLSSRQSLRCCKQKCADDLIRENIPMCNPLMPTKETTTPVKSPKYG